MIEENQTFWELWKILIFFATAKQLRKAANPKLKEALRNGFSKQEQKICQCLDRC